MPKREFKAPTRKSLFLRRRLVCVFCSLRFGSKCTKRPTDRPARLSVLVGSMTDETRDAKTQKTFFSPFFRSRVDN